MKRQIIVIFIITFGICVCLAAGNDKKMISAGSKGFALVELFTSEGCSSCPPAEVIMDKLIHKADSESLPVYVIEFHVDYWDYLGWKDTFALSEYSQRQQDYGDFFKLNSIYTPQAIINGAREVVVSDEADINASVAKGLQTPSAVEIDCKAYKTGEAKIQVEYTISGNISGCVLNVAFVESNLTTKVKKGENTGKTLTHDRVVRVFKSVKLNSDAGKITIDAPHVNLSNAKLICYVQNTGNMNITGATQISIAR